jgi:prophage antirepressor-like protein
MAIVAEPARPTNTRGRRRSAAHFDMVVLSYEGYELRAVVAGGEPWFTLRSILNIAPDGREALSRLDERDFLRLDPDKLDKGRTRLHPNGNDGAVEFVNETAAAELLMRKPTMANRDVVRWILREAGPMLSSAGLREVGPVPLVDAERYRVLVNSSASAPADRMDRPHVVYRFFDEDGRLLYVGISASARQRMTAHRATQPWWDDAAQVTFTRYPNYESARAAELEAIATEDPVYNRADRP